MQPVFGLDRARLRAAFERASAGYEAAAALQARVAAELLERLAELNFQPRVVLDLGAGTGRVTRELKRRYPRALVIAQSRMAAVGVEESLPFVKARVIALASSS